MPTKQEIEDELNERLDLDMEWSQMKKDDLEKFKEGLDDQEFVKKFVAQYMNTKAGDTVQEQVEGWEPGQALALVAQITQGEGNPIDMLM